MHLQYLTDKLPVDRQQGSGQANKQASNRGIEPNLPLQKIWKYFICELFQFPKWNTNSIGEINCRLWIFHFIREIHVSNPKIIHVKFWINSFYMWIRYFICENVLVSQVEWKFHIWECCRSICLSHVKWREIFVRVQSHRDEWILEMNDPWSRTFCIVWSVQRSIIPHLNLKLTQTQIHTLMLTNFCPYPNPHSNPNHNPDPNPNPNRHTT